MRRVMSRGSCCPQASRRWRPSTTDEPVLAACMSASSLTTLIAHGQNLLLYRTLELPADTAQRLAEVQRDIAVAAAYFEDKLGSAPAMAALRGPWLGRRL